MWYQDPNWQMTFMFLLALSIMGFVMKLTAGLVPPHEKVSHPFLFWLLLCPDTHRRLRSFSVIPGLIKRYFFLFIILTICLFGYGFFWSTLDNPFRFRSYMAVPVLFLMTEALVGFVTLIWLPSGKVLPTIHSAPWRLRSVADFWGHRWNLWFSDWARYTIFNPLKKRSPTLAILTAFVVSGLFHEWVINVPLFVLNGRPLFGSMMIYFIFQGLGVLFERKYLRKYPKTKRIVAWCWVVGPVPLVINEGLLRTMHLWPNES